MLRRFQAFAGLQIEMMLVDRRGHHNALAKAADQAAREYRGIRIRIVIADRKHARITLVDVKYRNLFTIDQSADAGVGDDVAQCADGYPMVELTVTMHVVLLASMLCSCRFGSHYGNHAQLAFGHCGRADL